MEGQTIFNIVVGVGLPALGWALRTLYDSIRDLQREVAAHRVEVARDYATNQDINEIKASLAEILRFLRDNK